MANLTFTPPADGAAVTMQNGRLCVPDRPVIPFIIGDGTGPEIWAAASRVIDAAVAKAYQGRRSIAWYEVFAGQKSFDNLGTCFRMKRWKLSARTSSASKAPSPLRWAEASAA